MPELPEVETVCRYLSSKIVGKKIAATEIRRRDLRAEIPEDVEERLEDARIRSVSRRAKYVLIETEKDFLVVHLGMSGSLRVFDSAHHLRKHDHVILTLDSGETVVFHDPRRFGVLLALAKRDLSSHFLFRDLGIEPFSHEFTAAWMRENFSARTSPIKTTLMNANILVGVGNIYASESLFRARILPSRAANSLSLSECKKLVLSIQDVLRAAIESGGSTLRDYVRADGDVGYFQHHFAVYGKAGEACEACGHPIKRSVDSGRSTFFCSHCQH